MAAARVRLGVLGWPVRHSRSPAMQNAALRAAGLPDWRYQLLPVPPEVFEETVRALPAAGFRGANVTIPHKEAALSVALPSAGASERARAIGAANTLLFDERGAIWAENTDAPGLIAALPRSVRGLRALVLGAGGTARAAVWALLHEGAAEVRVWNRTPERAAMLCRQIGGLAVSAAAPADLLVNCTSSGLDDRTSEFKQLPLTADEVARYDWVVDYVYSAEETMLVQAARASGVGVTDGLELLVCQGALSFELFTGAGAPVEAMRGAVRHDE